LEDIPKTIKNSLNNKNDLQLIGIIYYKQPPITTRSKIEHSIGHWTLYSDK